MHRFRSPIRFVLLLGVLLCLSARGSAQICRFCQGCQGSPTFGDLTATMDVVVIGTLREQNPPAPRKKEGAYRPVAYEVAQIIKGERQVTLQQLVQDDYYSDAAVGQPVLLAASKEGGTLKWLPVVVQLSPPLEVYIKKLFKLGTNEKERYLFFQSYLEHQDDVIARDVYDELAKFSYAKLRGMRDEMPHDSLVAWIQAKKTPTTHRRMYLQMLGICGNEHDIPMLVDEIVSEDPKKRGLDAVLACFLTLRGKAGLPLVEARYLSNKKADYTDTYAAIQALRFHATEEKIILRQDLLRGFHCILERPELADLVIPDLVRLEDWEPAERLAKLFKTADEKSSWVRIPVINYLRACPLPIADKLLKECEKLDPQSAERARRIEPVVEKKPLRVARGE